MHAQTKRAWSKPGLIVLVRHAAEEAVLAGGKLPYGGGGYEIGNVDCEFYVVGCGSYQSGQAS